MSKLAIQGGDKAITLDQSEASEWPIIDDEVTEAVVNQLQSGEISFSDTIYKFEEEFARLSRGQVCLGAQQWDCFNSRGAVRDWRGPRR